MTMLENSIRIDAPPEKVWSVLASLDALDQYDPGVTKAEDSDGSGTMVHQRMEYELKFGPVGKLMDAIMVKRKWDAGIKGFFAGLKHYVETGRRPSAKV